MRPAVRYCLTVGVALGGVSVVVAYPAAQPLKDVQVPAVQLFTNTHDSPDANGPSVADLLQVMNGLENPVVTQNITESDGSVDGGQPSNVPGLSDLLNLGNQPTSPAGQPGNSFVEIGPITPGDLTAVPAPPGT